MAVYKVRTFSFFSLDSQITFSLDYQQTFVQKSFPCSHFTIFKVQVIAPQEESSRPLPVKVKPELTPPSGILSATKRRGKRLIKRGSVVFLFPVAKKDSLWPTSKHRSAKPPIFRLPGRTPDPARQKKVGEGEKKREHTWIA